MKKVVNILPPLFAMTLIIMVIVQYYQWVNPREKEAGKIIRYSSLLSVLYQQKAAEMKAISWQTYNIAKFRLDEYLKQPASAKQPAVVVDIDETVLYNSKYQAKAILKGFGYPKEWKEWIEKVEADTLPGAAFFINYAESKGVKVLYISNRKEIFRKATLENLKKQGIDSVTNERLYLRNEIDSKEPRRKQVAEKYEIIMLIGDNLADFDVIWDDKKQENRSKAVDKMRMEFGSKFIILPNPVYGDWLDAIYDSARYSGNPDKVQRLLQGLVPF